jgi:UDP-N-acetylglucosamine 2-epimerase (non-hydrolysing)
MIKVLVLFGTRPEVIKLAPVIWALERDTTNFRCLTVSSSQHTDLLRPFVRDFDLRIDRDLQAMRPGQNLAGVFARVISSLAEVLQEEKPDIVLVQGDTTTAVAGALAAFYGGVAVGHVEAGLRTRNRHSPFPEEMNRRLITQIADIHFAATNGNAANLRNEGIPETSIVVTGNTVVDTLLKVLDRARPSPALQATLDHHSGRKIIVLTTHRRENFGEVMSGHLRALREFVEFHQDVALVLPVHPNPAVRKVVDEVFSHANRVTCIEPLEYQDFLTLLSKSWLIVSDSGGVQEEAPSLGKPLLVLRDTTERPEVIECGIGRLVGHDPAILRRMLEQAWSDQEWFSKARSTPNPFGDGRAAERIVEAIRLHMQGHKIGQ